MRWFSHSHTLPIYAFKSVKESKAKCTNNQIGQHPSKTLYFYFSLSSVASSGSVSSDSKMSITSDECRGPRQPQAKPPPKIIPAGKPPRHHTDPSTTGVPVVHPRKSLNTRPDSMNSDSGIIGSSGSDTSQVGSNIFLVVTLSCYLILAVLYPLICSSCYVISLYCH